MFCFFRKYPSISLKFGMVFTPFYKSKCITKREKSQLKRHEMCRKGKWTWYYYDVTKSDMMEGVNVMTIAERLIAARGDRRREDVADVVGVSLSAIAMYENGERIPRDEIKIRLADYYNTTVQALFLIYLIHRKQVILDAYLDNSRKGRRYFPE